MTEPVATSGARDAAATVLLRETRRAGWVKQHLPGFRSRLADPRDRALLTELVYGTVRRRGTLDTVLASVSRRPLRRLAPVVLTALRLGLYQVLFLDRVPAHAAVSHAVAWARAAGSTKGAGYVNGVLRAALRLVAGPAEGEEMPRHDVPRDDGSGVRLRRPLFPPPARDPAGNLAARFSAPRWLVERWLDAVGPSRTRARLEASLTRPPLVLRVRGPRDALLARLGDAARPGPSPDAVVVPGALEGPALAAVEAGEAAVQDATAQRVAPLLRLEPGQRVLDLCAAPGGKALHAADLLGGAGEVVACDVEPRKVAALAALADRVPPGVAWRVERVHRRRPLPFPPASFDAVLVDAPCTNTGVLRRRVEARWRLRPEDVATLAEIQRDLLARAWPLVRPGGRLVYATCSVEPEEDAAQVAAFLAAHPDAVLDGTLDVDVGREADGGFAAAFRKREPAGEEEAVR